MATSISSPTCDSRRSSDGTARSRALRQKVGWIIAGLWIGAAFLPGAFAGWNGEADALPALTVYKQPSCECCDRWVAGLRQRGFHVQVRSVADARPYRRNLGVTDTYRACHTALIEDRHHVLEGHVPIREIERLLAEHSTGQTLVVPGMPHGSPGMPHEDGHTDRYDVLRIDEAGQVAVYATYAASPGILDGATATAALPAHARGDSSMSYVAKVMLHSLLAILLGAGIMGIAYIHAHHDDKARGRRRRDHAQRDHDDGRAPKGTGSRVPLGDGPVDGRTAAGKTGYSRGR